MVNKSALTLKVYEYIKSTGGQGVRYSDHTPVHGPTEQLRKLTLEIHDSMANASMFTVRYRKEYRQTQHITKKDNKITKKTQRKQNSNMKIYINPCSNNLQTHNHNIQYCN